MKNLLFTTLCLFIYIKANAQNANTGISKNERITNLFEYGESVISPETNFKNLFKNFPLFISGNDVKLISYQFVKRIKNSNDALFFVKKNSDIIQLMSGVTMAMGGSDGFQESFIKFNFGINPNFTKKQMKKMYVEKCRKVYLDKPALVYVIKFSARGQEHKYYTFVNPDTHKAITNGNMFGFDFPISYAEYKEKNARE